MSGGLTALSQSGDGFIVKIRAQPGAPRTRVVGILGDALKIAVQAPPERGKANEEVRDFLATILGVPTSAVVLKSGAGNRNKVYWVRAQDAAPLLSAINQAVGKTT